MVEEKSTTKPARKVIKPVAVIKDIECKNVRSGNSSIFSDVTGNNFKPGETGKLSKELYSKFLKLNYVAPLD